MSKIIEFPPQFRCSSDMLKGYGKREDFEWIVLDIETVVLERAASGDTLGALHSMACILRQLADNPEDVEKVADVLFARPDVAALQLEEDAAFRAMAGLTEEDE